jgi:hypothetical protein
MSCKISTEFQSQMNNVGITDLNELYKVYNANNNRLLDDPQAKSYRLYEGLRIALQSEGLEEDAAKDEALLLTYYSLTPDFKKLNKEPVLEVLQDYRDQVEENNRKKAEDRRNQINLTTLYSATINDLVLDEVSGNELYNVLTTLSVMPVDKAKQEIQKVLDGLLQDATKRELTEEEQISVSYLTKVLDNYSQVLKWYNALRKEKKNLVGFIDEESEVNDPTSEETSNEEDNRAGGIADRETKHISEIGGDALKAIIQAMPVLERTVKTEGKITKIVFQIKKSNIFRMEMADDRLKTNYNIIFNLLAQNQVSNYAQALKVLENNTSKYPQLSYLVRSLPKADYYKPLNKDDDPVQREKNLTIVSDFMNTFNLREVTPFAVNISQLGRTNQRSIRLFSKLSNSEVFRLEKYDKNISIDSRRAKYLTNNLLDLSKVFYKKENEKATLFSSTTGVTDKIAQAITFEQQLLDKRESFAPVNFEAFMDLLFVLGVDIALEFKKSGTFHAEAKQFFSVKKNKKALLSMLNKVYQKSKYQSKIKGSPLLASPLKYIYSDVENLTEEQKKEFSFLASVQKSEVKTIFNFINQLTPESYSPSYLNSGKKLKNAVPLYNHLNQIVSALNESSTYQEFISKTEVNGDSPYDIISNPKLLSSQWLHSMFEGLPKNYAELKEQYESLQKDFPGETSTQSKLRFFAKFKRNKNIEINLVDLSGVERVSIDREFTKVTSDLNITQKILSEIASMFDRGIIENIRFGDKTSTYGVLIQNLASPTAKYYLDFGTSLDPNQNPKLASMLESYVTAELQDLVLAIKKNKKNKVSTFAQRKQQLYLGDMFSQSNSATTFQAIQDKVSDLVESYLKNEDTSKETEDAFFKSIMELQPSYVAHILDGFSLYVETSREQLKSKMNGFVSETTMLDWFNRHNIIKPLQKGLNIQTLTIDSLNKALDFFIVNGLIHNIEFMTLIGGGLYNFKNSKDVFTRLSNMSSPGKMPNVGVDAKEIFKNSNPANAITKIFGGISSAQRWGKLHTLTFKEVDTFFGDEKVWQDYREAYSLPDTEAYRQYVVKPKEADAQAVATLEFIRNYLKTTGTWNDEKQEVTYNYEVQIAKELKELETATPAQKERIRTKISKIKARMNSDIKRGKALSIPILKLGHVGRSISNSQDIVNHKMSVLPLLPSQISEFPEIYGVFKRMYESSVDYYVFESGSKQANSKPLLDFYDKDGNVNDSFELDDVTSLDVRNLKELQYQSPERKSSAVLTSQGVGLLFGDIFDAGTIDESSEFVKFIDNQRKKMTAAIAEIVKIRQAKFDFEFGIIRNESGDITAFDEIKVAKFLSGKYDEFEESRKYYQVEQILNEDKIKYSIENHPSITKAHMSILNKITKEIIKFSINGDSLVQAAQTPFLGKRKRTFTAEDFKSGGAVGLNSGLKFYRLVDGEVLPMEIMVAWDSSKHDPLLNLEYLGKNIRDYTDTDYQSIDLINKILASDNEYDKEWVEKHKKLFIYTGVRIPVQGKNSMEVMQVKKFLPASSGNIIVLPPQIVTKSGGDYDIDKLTVYYPNLDKNGKPVKSSISFAEYKEALALLPAKKFYLGRIKKTIEYFLEHVPNISDNMKAVLTDFDTQLEQAKIKSEDSEMLPLNLENPIEEMFRLIDEFRYEISSYEELLNLENSKQNDIIDVFVDTLSRKELYEALVKPNESPNTREAAERTPSIPILGLDIYNPITSYRIFEETMLAKNALGIDAKANKLHKIFQQANIQYLFGETYFFPSNVTEGGLLPLGRINFSSEGPQVYATISDILNEFINGHVDVKKEDFLLRLNMTQQITPLAHVMLLNGTAPKIVFNFFKSPEVRNMLLRSQKDELIGKPNISLEQQFNEMLSSPEVAEIPLLNELISNLERQQMLYPNDRIFNYSGFSKLVTAPEYSSVFNPVLEYINSEEGSQYNFDFFLGEFFALHQLITIKREAAAVRELISIVDYNTATYKAPYDTITIPARVQALRQSFTGVTSLSQYNPEIGLTAFNIVKDINNLFTALYPNIFNSDVQEEISNIYLEQTYEESDQTTKNRRLDRFIKLIIDFQKFRTNKDDVRGYHVNYFFSQNPNEPGIFYKVNGVSKIESDLKSLLEDPEYSYLNNNFFIVNLNRLNTIEATPEHKYSHFVHIEMFDEEAKLKNQQDRDALLNHPDERVRTLFTDLLLGVYYSNLGAYYSPLGVEVPVSVYGEYNKASEEVLSKKLNNSPEFNKIKFVSSLNITKAQIGNNILIEDFNALQGLATSAASTPNVRYYVKKIQNASRNTVMAFLRQSYAQGNLPYNIILPPEYEVRSPAKDYIYEVKSLLTTNPNFRIAHNYAGRILRETVKTAPPSPPAQPTPQQPPQAPTALTQESNKGQINFQEEPSAGYIERTKKNASADATIDFGLNQKGEPWTKKAVDNNRKKYIGINTNNLTITTEMINEIVNALNSVNAKTLNIAGMGIYNMKKHTQEQVDKFIYDLLNQVINSPNLKTKIESIRSGGQTGFDEAGAKASIKLGLPTIVLAPKNWIFRDANGKDISNEQQFKARFTNTQTQAPTAPSVVSEPPSSVKPVVKDLKRWSELSNATQPYTDKGIVVTRISNTQEHFGNPFIGSKRRDKQGNLIEAQVNNITVFNTIEEADQAYREWLMGTAHQNIQPARREWILKQINEGKLDGKTLLYYKPDEVINNDGTIVKGGYHSHADTLAEIVEELRGAQPTSKSSEKVNPLVAAGIKPTDMYGNAAKDIQMAEESTQFIGFQSGSASVSSTNKYRLAWGDKANTGNYSANDVIMVSGSGTFRGVTEKQIREALSEKYKPLLNAAIAAGSSFRVGNQYAKGNLSDQLIAEYLKAKGYIEEKLNGYSRWTPSQPTSKPSGETTEVTFDQLGLSPERKESILNSLVSKFPDKMKTPQEAIDFINNALKRNTKEEILDALNTKDKNGNYCY